MKAYDEPSGVFVHGNTMYVAGTRTTSEWFDDLTLPLGAVNRQFGVAHMPRSHAAFASLSPAVKRVVGHSMGGAVALDIAAQDPRIKAVTYGAPVFLGSQGDGERYRDTLDPVSMFDVGATNVGVHIPHTAGFDWYHHSPGTQEE